MPSSTPSKSPERIFLTDADHVAALLFDGARTRVDRESARHFERLSHEFGRKPYKRTCSYGECVEPAKLATYYESTAGHPMFWCTWDHLEKRVGPSVARVTQVWDDEQAFEALVDHVRSATRPRLSAVDLRKLVRITAMAKGLGPRVTDATARAFFAGCQWPLRSA